VRALKPTVDTKFHIDLNWWQRQNKDIRIFLLDVLCEECRGELGDLAEERIVDMIDRDTAEVKRVDATWEAIGACCSVHPGYITMDTPLLESIFRVFLANGNKPLSLRELHARLDRKPPETILRLLTKGRVYLGIRPV
jgi:hypothetical protein